jgi:hypothetical protein
MARTATPSKLQRSAPTHADLSAQTARRRLGAQLPAILEDPGDATAFPDDEPAVTLVHREAGTFTLVAVDPQGHGLYRSNAWKDAWRCIYHEGARIRDWSRVGGGKLPAPAPWLHWMWLTPADQAAIDVARRPGAPKALPAYQAVMWHHVEVADYRRDGSGHPKPRTELAYDRAILCRACMLDRSGMYYDVTGNESWDAPRCEGCGAYFYEVLSVGAEFSPGYGERRAVTVRWALSGRIETHVGSPAIFPG